MATQIENIGSEIFDGNTWRSKQRKSNSQNLLLLPTALSNNTLFSESRI